MKQQSLTDIEYSGRRRKTMREPVQYAVCQCKSSYVHPCRANGGVLHGLVRPFSGSGFLKTGEKQKNPFISAHSGCHNK